MSIRLWPEDFRNRDHITRECKQLMGFAEKCFLEGHFTVNIDPLGLSSNQKQFGLYISPNEGLLTFTVDPDPIDENNVTTYITYVELIEKMISERLLDAKALISRNGSYKRLSFPYKHIMVFQNETVASVSSKQAQLKPLKGYTESETVLFSYFPSKKRKTAPTSNIKLSAGCLIHHSDKIILRHTCFARGVGDGNQFVLNKISKRF